MFNIKFEPPFFFEFEGKPTRFLTISKSFLYRFTASPKVILNRAPEAIYDQPFSFTAVIRSFPKHVRVIWMKGNEHIDITQPKYNGSLDVGYHPVLCINNVKEEDEDVYTIKVRNGIGNDACCAERLIIMKGKNVSHTRTHTYS